MALQRLDGVWFTFHSDLSLDNGGFRFRSLVCVCAFEVEGCRNWGRELRA